MRIVEVDLVDWEPLRIRFMPKAKIADPELLAAEIENWFTTNAAKARADCNLSYWQIISKTSAQVEVACEHLTRKALSRLGRDMAKRCPDLDHLVIGEHLDGQPGGVSFDWTLL